MSYLSKRLCNNYSIIRLYFKSSPIYKQQFIQLRLINIASETTSKSSGYEKPRSLTGYLFALLPVATFCLGTWQIYRLRWKLDLISKLESIINNDPIDFPEQLEKFNEMEYVKVKVKGHVDSKSKPEFIFPRSMIQRDDKKIQSGSLITQKSQRQGGLGAQLILPFIVTDKRFNENSVRILVNFGWINRDTMDKINSIIKNHKIDFNQQKEFELIGVIRKTEKREPFTPKQEFTKGYWTRRDIEKMSEQLKTNPIYLDAFETYDLKLTFKNGQEQFDITPIGGQTRVNIRNEHLSYIITWYSLTGIFSYLWYKKIFKSRL